MFTQSVSSPPVAASSPTPAPSASTSTSTNIGSHISRSSRLRGLSYLRNYTPAHLLSRDHSPSSASSATPATSTTTGTKTPPSRPTHPTIAGLARSASFSPSTSPSRQFQAPESLSGSAPNQSALNPLPDSVPKTKTNHDRIARTSDLSQPRIDQREPLTPDMSVASASRTVEVTQPTESTMTRGRASTTGDQQGASSSMDHLPSIRFSAYYDTRAPRPSLKFQTVSRTLPTGNEIIKVGRYSERDKEPQIPINAPSAAPVGFKSKVVSRRHCEFWFENGKWYIRDVKSSSGTFLNHIRLSPPATESKPYVVNDGDIVQLGIDFKGGEEMIFRCVKMRLELNRGWQSKLNTFNMSTHKQLRSLAGPTGSSSQDCSICLNSIAPCQSLFVAPCSHTWHFKCIRSLINSPQYPIFMCPNCRAAADLEAEVDDAEEWEQLSGEEAANGDGKNVAVNGAPDLEEPSARVAELNGAADAGDTTVRVDFLAPTSVPQSVPPRSHTQSEPVPIASSSGSAYLLRNHRTPSPDSNGIVTNGHEGPITPRNDAGPWVFDGSAGEGGSPTGSTGGMRSIDSTALETDRRP